MMIEPQLLPKSFRPGLRANSFFGCLSDVPFTQMYLNSKWLANACNRFLVTLFHWEIASDVRTGLCRSGMFVGRERLIFDLVCRSRHLFALQLHILNLIFHFHHIWLNYKFRQAYVSIVFMWKAWSSMWSSIHFCLCRVLKWNIMDKFALALWFFHHFGFTI